MADLYTQAQTVSNAGATQATLGSNARRAVISYPTNLDGTFDAASPFSQFGTRELVLLKATAGDGTPFATADLDDSQSAFAKSIEAIQLFAELFYVQRISDTVIAFIVADNTRNGAEVGSNVQATTYGAMEAALGTATGETVTVAAAALS